MLELNPFQIGLLSAFLVVGIYIYFKISYRYWKKRGIPTLEPTVPFGNFGGLMFSDINPTEKVTNLYKAFDGHKLAGLYRLNQPSLLVRDPEIIKDIMVKDFEHFYSRGIDHDERYEPLQGHLFALNGPKWRNMRVKMTPTFTSGKMKMMFGTLAQCGKELAACLKKKSEKSEPVEIKDILARYSTDIIASCAFGIQCNCLKNPEAEFRLWGRKIFASTLRSWLFRMILLLAPSLIYFLKFSFIPKDVSNYFRRMVKETVEYREKNNVQRSDFMQLLIQLKNKTLGAGEDEAKVIRNGSMDDLNSKVPMDMDIDALAAQAFVFFIAGFETSSTTMTFCLYELALNPDIQERVREEIDTILEKHNGQLTYDAVMEMEYLDKVVSEAMRKYPALPLITRQCTKPVKLRGTDVTVEKGMQILLPVQGLHHDPKYFPDPEKFDPSRFEEEEKKKRPHFCYLPFGEGPRLCIGMRFGLMQTKVGLISILSNFDVQVCAETPIPMKFDAKTIIPSPAGGLWLKMVDRN